MYLHEPCYDIDELFSRNLHIHTSPESRCAKPEMILNDVIAAAEAFGLEEIAITNHIQACEEEKCKAQYEHLKRLAEEIPHRINIRIGAELSAYGIDKFNFHDESSPLDFNLYAHNHYHLDAWEQPEDRSAYGYKNHCTDVIKKLLISGKADAMAHPFTDGYIVREFEEDFGFTYGCITSLWTENELGDILALGKEHSTAWELNTKALIGYPEFAKMYFHLGKEIGVCFTVGSDAHRICDMDITPVKDTFRKLLDA